MRRLITVTLLTLGMTLVVPAMSAQACPGEGGSHHRNQSGVGFTATNCRGNDNGNNNPGGNNTSGGNTSRTDVPAGNSTSEDDGPKRRTVSREEYNRLFENCLRGPDRDALSIQCAAALPDIEDEADAGTAATPQVTAEQVREIAVARLDLGRPDIGASPCLAPAGGCRGTAGVPVWLWVGDGSGALPSDTASATAGPYTIRATARVSKVKWSLGDGQSTVCTGPGRAYDAQRDGWSTPTCGFDHGWKRAGSHTLTATYVWEVSWSGADSGSFTQEMSSTQDVTVGELQSVVKRP